MAIICNDMVECKINIKPPLTTMGKTSINWWRISFYRLNSEHKHIISNNSAWLIIVIRVIAIGNIGTIIIKRWIMLILGWKLRIIKSGIKE